MVFEISKTSRELLAFKHATALHKEVLDSFSSAAGTLFDADYAHYTEATLSEYMKVEKTIHSLYESLSEIRQTNGALLEAKQNQNIMTLTGITLITTVIGVPMAIFEINFRYAPIIGTANDFWVFTGLITAAAIALAAILVHKKWL